MKKTYFILIPAIIFSLWLYAAGDTTPQRSWPGLLFRPGFGQQLYFPYYGKNKINYEDFRWKTIH